MAKKKRNLTSNNAPSSARALESLPDMSAQAGTASTERKITQKTSATAVAMPLELGKGDWTAILLALMMFFAPALGVPHEMMLQDTLKSIIVAFFVLGAALLLFWSQRNRRDAFRWHGVMWLPIMLTAYALVSMYWAHTFLSGVEAVRWFIFAVMLWLTVNCASRDKFTSLAWGVHLGALGVAMWGAAQFWFDLKYIPQGPPPASTFVNRNFAAEFMGCTVAFSGYLLLSNKQRMLLALLAFTTAFNIVFILMCGTRSALVGTAASIVIFTIVAVVYRKQLVYTNWDGARRILVIGIFLSTIVGLGLIKSGNAAILDAHVVEGRGTNALERGFNRAKQIKIGDGSLGVRFVMWKATQRIIEKRPFSGVGAGTWEAALPLYQAEGSQLETDYYVHNEVLQLIAEYGIVGWIFLIWLAAYLLLSAWRTLRNRSIEGMNEGPLRVTALCSLLALMIVSNIGFPWRLAATGAIFALCLGVLAASDARLGYRGFFSATRLSWKPAFSQTAAVTTMLCLALAAFITQQAAECEDKIVRGVKMALTISQSGDFNNPKWDKTKIEMLKLVKEGTDINPHYRKITPMVADELAKWGDWKNAVWVWESVVSSRPYVVALMSNIARGYAQMGQNEKALAFLERCKKIQPKAAGVRSLEVILLSRMGREPEAYAKAKEYYKQPETMDFDMLNAGYVLAVRKSDFQFAIDLMQLRNKNVPGQEIDGWLKIATVYTNFLKDEPKAVEAFKEAMKFTKPENKEATLKQIPAYYHPKL
jgi:O-antigen ligase